ncbi:tetratricopeptide repeat protein 14 isoform X1 [Etheostoma cragini]|uniref:tetratricopeptide repeat protein 14 isoform X1 n=1 Tax=Etheostoma cragini TaxID=417921 RepID=UPI00155DE1C8|nr:tetratricopeptide repeat protein 14 isoform X1 [Etheostoma cragini]XP_034736565.1 tetratricopeptide repeat protein 14 isoform X1 [Etheostoma cragini]XP_034736566.1 tetratricopeptide repeat protein 14 isoform X1 [Etheostoma cragini]
MDRDLLRQCLTYHGQSLFNKLKCEQIENPDFQAVVSDLCKATCESKSDGPDSPLVEQFIARKADILFCPAWKTAIHQEEEQPEEEDAAEPYAIMPPVELFMKVSYDERRAMLYRDLEKGDLVVGRINNIREYGFFLTLLCTAGGLKRDIEDLELSALCHIKEIPSTGSHDDPLSYYQIGDLIRAAVKDIDRYQEKITVSLHQASLFPSLKLIKLGVFPREELPIHYSRSVHAAVDSSETYECILKSCHGYHNPSVVDYLLEKVGVSDTHPPSMMRGLQSKLFQEEDFASAIRKKQSASWALKCVRAGVDHFKHGRHVEAMNEYNKALHIDTNNVEALVARGALYANKGSIMKAISDFELALVSCPDHRNAKKYLCQTLVERGKQLEEQEKLVTAEGLYRRALSLDDSNPEVQEALHKITDTIQKSIRLREEALAKEQKATSSQTSAEKLRKILKEDKRMKKKRKRSASSSSSSTFSRNSSPSSSSSSRRRSKKKKKKRRRSERGSKRYRRISTVRSEEGKSEKDRKEEDEVEWYPAPPNTSATFLNQKGGPGFGERDEEELVEKDSEDRRICQLYSLSAASEDGESDSSRRNRKRGDREESRTRKRKNTLSRSPEREQRRSRSREREGKSRDRGMEDYRKDRRGSDSKRRSSLDENRKRKVSCSSAESEYSRKSSFTSGYLGNSGSASKHVESRMRHDSSRWNSFDGGRYENKGWEEIRELEEAKTNGRKGKVEDERSDAGNSKNSEGAGNHKQSSLTSIPVERPKKDLPSNLLDIFHQIAQFEKEKGVGPK